MIIYILLFVTSVHCLYEDQVGDFDWYQQYVGHVTWSSLEQAVGNRRKVLLASTDGVLGAINAGPGTIAWRQNLNEPLTNVLHYRSALLTISGDSHMIVRCWDAVTGFLKWEVPTSFVVPVNKDSLNVNWRPGGLLMIVGGAKNDQLVVVGNTLLVVYSLRSGKELWNITIKENQIPCYLTASDSIIQLWYLSNQQILSNSINLNDRKQSNLVIISDHTPWLNVNTSCDITNDKDIVCLESSELTLYSIDKAKKNFQPLIFQDDIIISSNDVIRFIDDSMFKVGSHVFTIDTKLVKLICTKCTICNLMKDQEKVSVRVEETEHQIIIHFSTNQEQHTVTMDTMIERGGVVNVDVYILNRPGTIWRALIYREDSSISFISNTGELIWVREEGLANIVKVEMVDLPPSQAATEGFLTLLDGDSNPLLLAAKRLTFQFELLQDFVQDVMKRGVASIIAPADTEQLLRDNFNTRKLLVAMTSYNKLYGLDTNNGRIIWQLYIPGLHPLVNEIFILRSSVHLSHLPLAVIVGVAQSCKDGSIIYEFHLITGELTNQICLPYRITQLMLLPFIDHTHQRTLLLLDTQGHTHCYPNECNLQTSAQIFLYTADTFNGKLNGLYVNGAEFSTKEVWHTLLPRNEKIIKIVNNRHGYTHSIGQVKFDRSVQYKYLNPNLVAMATETTDQSRPNLNIYLLDVVNGGVVYHVTHKFSSKPVNIVLCENWMIYTFYNIKSYRYEIVVVELYDPRNETESVWSSLAPPTLPIAVSQSYTFSTAVVTLSHTVTQRSITHKSLLFGLTSGHIITIHKDLLDPRRNITPTQEMMDEGIPVYIPQLPVDPRFMINYNKTVTNIQGIHTGSTGLESTSLVFAYGLDLYLTRVTPSKQFDMLAEDFDYLLIAGVVSVLTLGTIALAYFASRKNLNLLWK